jgi:hypothetical protein
MRIAVYSRSMRTSSSLTESECLPHILKEVEQNQSKELKELGCLALLFIVKENYTNMDNVGR